MHERSSYFCDSFLVSKWIFHHHDRGLTKFHAGSEQSLVCVITINFVYPTVKNNNKAYHAFGKYWMQARGFLNHHLKYCWPKVICCRLYVYQTNLNGKLRKKLGGQAKIWGWHGPPRPPLESPLPAGTLFRGPAVTEGPENEGMFQCLLLTNSE